MKNSNLLAVCTDSGSLHIVEDIGGKHKLHHLPRLHRKLIRAVQFSNDGARSFTGSDDGEIKMVDLEKMKPIRSYMGHQSYVNALDVHPTDNKLFVSCSYDYTVRLWDTVSGQCIEQFSPFDKKQDNIWQVKFNFDGTLVGVCSQSGQLNFYSRY